MLRSSRIAPLAVILFSVAACQDAGLTSPAAEGLAAATSQFSEHLSLPELQQSADSAAVRIEVKLQQGNAPLIAREVERADAGAAREREKIESRVTAAGEQGLTLALGGLEVTFDASTRFRSEDGDTLTRAEFVSRLRAALAAGRRPSVEAERPAPAQPQAPEDAAFVAAELEIDDEASEPRLELNIDADNLLLDAAPPADALIRVLGLSIQIRRGATQVEGRRPEKREKAKFEGIVASADAAGGSVTLRDGRSIRVVQGTEIETGQDKLSSVAEVAAALAAGQMVEAQGRGIHEDPTTILAVEVEFEVELEADDVPNPARLKHEVTAVDVQNRTFTLAGGQVVRVVDGTRIRGEGLATLQQVADAIAAGRAVRADGKLLLESGGPPARYVALEVRFRTEDGDERDDAPGLGRIEGRVARVDLQAGTFTLTSGNLVRLTAATVIDADGDLKTLLAVSEALAAGEVVRARGQGTLEAAGPPRVLVATAVGFETDEDDEEEEADDEEGVKLDARVASVDVVGRKLTLEDGRVVRLAENARIEGRVRTLQQAADALIAGKTVAVEGTALVESEGPPVTLVARRLKLRID